MFFRGKACTPTTATPQSGVATGRCLREDFSVAEVEAALVFGAEGGREALERPGDGEFRVVPADGAFVLGGVVVGGFVEDVGGFGEDEEAVGEAGGDPEDAFVFSGDVDPDGVAEGWGVFANVESDVEDFAAADAEEFSLGVLDLVVKSAEDAAGGTGMIVLDEWEVDAGFFGEGAGVVAFEEEAAWVAEDFGLEDQDIREFSADDVHEALLGKSLNRQVVKSLSRLGVYFYRLGVAIVWEVFWEYYGLNLIPDFCR